MIPAIALIKNSSSNILEFVNQRALEQLDRFYHCSEQRQRLIQVFGDDLKDVNFKEFCTAYGLLGLANKAGSFQNPPQVNQDALDFLPNGLDIESYSTDWLVGSGINFALNIHNEEIDLLEEVLKLIHQHNAIGNWAMGIDHLHSAICDSRLDAQKITCDLADKTALDLFGEIAQDSIEDHVGFIERYGFDDDTSNFCLTDGDIERINQCDLAILAIMRQNFFAYDIDININYYTEDVLASFMAVHNLFVKYQNKDCVEKVRQAITDLTQPTEEVATPAVTDTDSDDNKISCISTFVGNIFGYKTHTQWVFNTMDWLDGIIKSEKDILLNDPTKMDYRALMRDIAETVDEISSWGALADLDDFEGDLRNSLESFNLEDVESLCIYVDGYQSAFADINQKLADGVYLTK